MEVYDHIALLYTSNVLHPVFIRGQSGIALEKHGRAEVAGEARCCTPSPRDDEQHRQEARSCTALARGGRGRRAAARLRRPGRTSDSGRRRVATGARCGQDDERLRRKHSFVLRLHHARRRTYIQANAMYGLVALEAWPCWPETRAF
jgi:hypothetical protein